MFSLAYLVSLLFLRCFDFLATLVSDLYPSFLFLAFCFMIYGERRYG